MSRTLALVVLPLLVACAGTRRHVRDQHPDPGPVAVAPLDTAASVAVGARPGVDELPLEVQRLVSNLARVHFETDTAHLTADAEAALGDNASILLRHPDVRIEVQGHADERGTTDYNLALGHRRAVAIQRALQAHGVPSDRVAPTTFGEEVPLDSSGSEAAWAVNRRAEFRVTWSGDGLVQGSID